MRQARADNGNGVSMHFTGGKADMMSVEMELEEWTQYWYDVLGKALRQALAEKIAIVKKMKVWMEVDREECFKNTGRPLMELR